MNLGIIPARYASTRFPGKPLAVIDGKSMIRRVWEQCSLCPSLHRVIVATDDERIETHVAAFGGEVIMTSPGLPSGTARCAAAMKAIDSKEHMPWEVVVNIQGDEPFIDPAQIDLVINCFKRKDVDIATLARLIEKKEDLLRPDVVKVVRDSSGFALYFSRHAIPFTQGRPVEEWYGSFGYLRHIGLYAYRPSSLMRITSAPPSALAQAESLEQLAWLEAGEKIFVGLTDYESLSVDRPEDLVTFNTPRND